jgi:hypothetical protein
MRYTSQLFATQEKITNINTIDFAKKFLKIAVIEEDIEEDIEENDWDNIPTILFTRKILRVTENYIQILGTKLQSFTALAVQRIFYGHAPLAVIIDIYERILNVMSYSTIIECEKKDSIIH